MAPTKRAAAFGTRLRCLRERALLTQEQLAELVDRTKDAIGGYERGLHMPSLPTIRALADALALSGTELEAFVAMTVGPAGAGAPDATPHVVPPTPPPRPRTPFFARDDDLAALARLLGGESRFVTLTGPPGVGKSRLALEAAARFAAASPGGVGFADLAPLRDPALVATAVAGAVGLAERGARPLPEQIAAHLGIRPLLLVLDNIDPVVEAAQFLVDLVAAAPGLRVLATGREALRITGETRYPVAPLDTASAAMLFVERAHAADPSFDPQAHRASIAGICARLEGLPLALELAAARLRFLSPGEVLTGLESRLRLLAHGPRDLPPHQRALRAAIDWSHDLLTPDERLVFRRLAVFAGGCTIEAATAVCDRAEGLSPPTLAAPVVLEALVDKSLVHEGGAGRDDVRFAMLDSLREYATERLAESGEGVRVTECHARYYLRLGFGTMDPPGQAEAAVLGLLAREIDNLRTAMRWWLAHGDASTGFVFPLILFLYWYARGGFAEGRYWTRALLARPGGNPELRGEVMGQAAALAILEGDWGEAGALAERAHAFGGEYGLATLQARAAQQLSYVAQRNDDPDGAASWMAESLAHWRSAAAERGGREPDQVSAVAQIHAGWSAERGGDHAAARAIYAAVLADGRARGDTWAITAALGELAELAREDGDLLGARALVEEGVTLARGTGNWTTLGHLTILLGEILLLAGDRAAARAPIEEALALYRAMGDEGQADKAAALLAQIDAEG